MNRIILPGLTFICALMIVCLIAFGATAGLIVLAMLVPLALGSGCSSWLCAMPLHALANGKEGRDHAG